MAVIFFDGFSRPLTSDHWVPQNTGDYNVSANYLAIPIDAYVDLIPTGNVATTLSGRKVYFGLRFSYSQFGDDSPLLSFLLANGTSVLDLTWNVSGTTYPAAGINVVLPGSPPTTVATFNLQGICASYGLDGNGNPLRLLGANQVIEIELDLDNSTIAFQANGITVFKVGTENTSADISGVTEFAKIRIYGNITAASGWPNNPTQKNTIYVADDTGSFANTWLGPDFQVASPSLYSNTNESAAAMNSSGAGAWSGDASYLNVADGDGGYVRTGDVNKYLFTLFSAAVTGSQLSPAVGAIRVNSTARKVTLNSAYKYVWRNNTAQTNWEMGSQIDLTENAYKLQKAQFLAVNPETNSQWTLAQINNNYFGLKSVAAS